LTQVSSYWVAAHLTGIFQIKDESLDVLHRGSRGAGVSINRGVTTTISKTKSSHIEIIFNGIKKAASEAVVTSCIIKLLVSDPESLKLQITHNFEVPLSSGYGASAAGALGTAFALNDVLELGLSEIECFQTAHKAEVLSKSGLGDVIGLYQGGLEIRMEEGAPGIGKTIPMSNNTDWKVATVHFGTLPTSEVLTNASKRKIINKFGSEAISKLVSDPHFGNFIQLSSIFTNEVELWTPRMKDQIQNLPSSVTGAQIMLGEAFFIFYRHESDLKKINIPDSQINKETICQTTVVRRS
jgi:pantoate kinase